MKESINIKIRTTVITIGGAIVILGFVYLVILGVYALR